MTGSIDAYVYIGGALFGMVVYGFVYPAIEGLVKAGSLGYVKIPEFFNISTGLVAFGIVVMAVGMFVGAEWLEKKFGEEEAG